MAAPSPDSPLISTTLQRLHNAPFGAGHMNSIELCAKLHSLANHFEASIHPFRLFNLPAELRNRIYEYVVVGNDFPLLLSTCVQYHKGRTLAVQPAITRVCKQLRQEALPIFYSRNEFDIHIHRCDFDDFFKFMDTIGERNRSHIRTVWFILKDRWTCGRGLLDFVRWCTYTSGIDNMELGVDVQSWEREHRRYRASVFPGHVGNMVSTESYMRGAIRLGSTLGNDRVSDERKLRRDFFQYIRTYSAQCECEELYRLLDDYPFDGYCTDYGRHVHVGDELAESCCGVPRR